MNSQCMVGKLELFRLWGSKVYSLHVAHAVPQEEGSGTAGVLSAETIQNDASDYRDLSLR